MAYPTKCPKCYSWEIIAVTSGSFHHELEIDATNASYANPPDTECKSCGHNFNRFNKNVTNQIDSILDPEPDGDDLFVNNAESKIREEMIWNKEENSLRGNPFADDEEDDDGEQIGEKD